MSDFYMQGESIPPGFLTPEQQKRVDEFAAWIEAEGLDGLLALSKTVGENEEGSMGMAVRVGTNPDEQFQAGITAVECLLFESVQLDENTGRLISMHLIERICEVVREASAETTDEESEPDPLDRS